ncbi:MAG TPA: PAS domain S-box protein, partial [Planctomycetaceae bacterium]|nr:PAS domain S-box protein [Planctomycetaceae bacterium]
MRAALEQVRRHIERQTEESRRLAEAQADAIVHAAEIISELEETRQRLEDARARAEAAALEAQRLSAFGDILDQSLAEIYIVDQESLALVHVNRGARENVGYPLEQLRKMTLADINGELQLDDLRKMAAPLLDGTRDSLELTTVHRRRDGSQYPVRVHLEASRFDERPVLAVTALDITEQTRMLH